ncbi:MAG: LamG-like jellyroll fold domain-containing protein [Candidatus Thorarchaeota archaeon]
MRKRVVLIALATVLVLTLASVPAFSGIEGLTVESKNQMMIAQCIEPPSGVVSWWTGDGHYRDVAGVNPMNPEYDTTFAPGMVDEAFSFDGVDDFMWATGEGIDHLQELTIEAWVYLNSLPDRIMRFVTLAPPGLERAVIRYGWRSAEGLGQLHFYMRIGDETIPFKSLRVENVLQTGVWHHVAGTFDGEYMRVYLDGEEKASRYTPGPIAIGENHGVRMSSYDEPLDGRLDEVAVYNRALDPSEIQSIFNAGSEGKCRPQDIVRDPEYLNLGVVDIGDHSKGIVTVTNEGDYPLTIFEAELLPWSCEDLSISMYSDQVNDITSGLSMGMGNGIPGSLYQSFVPAASPLLAASIRLRVGGYFPDTGYTTTINLRSGTWDGPILATASAYIPGYITSGQQVDVLFQFQADIAVNPGTTYIIEWISPLEGGSWLSWMASDENPYSGGNVFNHLGDPYVDRDFVFATFVPKDVMCDQSNFESTGTNIYLGIPGSLYQSFVPTATSMIAASIRLRAGVSFPEYGYESTIRIRYGSWDGPVIATSSEYINGPLLVGEQVDKLYRFPDGVELTPGETYFIEWISPIQGGSYLSWMASDLNPYPDGTAIGPSGDPIENIDFVFATYLPIVLLPGGSFKIGITYTPTFIGECVGELVIFSNDPGEHVIYVPMSGRSTLAHSAWIEYPVFLDGQISYADEWADTEPVEVHPRRAWNWPNKMEEVTDISYYARFKNDDEWLYLLYEATWTSTFSSPEAAAVSMFFFGGNPNTDSDAGWVVLGGGTWDPYGWSGGGWFSDVDTSTGTNDVEGTGYFDGTTYWFEFRKRLDSGDGYDWSFEPGDLMGNRINPWAPPHMLINMWDSDTQSTYEQNVAVQLSTLTFNDYKLNNDMLRFERKDDVIHIFAFDDVGTEGQPPAVVRFGQPLIIGFEWTTTPDASVKEFSDLIIGNPEHKICMTYDGSAAMSLKSWYQECFYAETFNGPRWMWDHDGDGPGDRDRDGIGDWLGPVIFFRYEVFKLPRGTHTFEFAVYIGSVPVYLDIVTVIVR